MEDNPNMTPERFPRPAPEAPPIEAPPEMPPVEAELTPEEQEFFGEQVKDFAAEEEKTLDAKAIALVRSGGVFQKLLPYKRHVNAFVLASVVAGVGANKSSETLQEIGERAEAQLIEEFPEEAVEIPEAPGEEAIKILAQKNPFAVMRRLSEFKDEPYAEEVVLSVAERVTDLAFEQLPQMQNQPYFQNTVDLLVTSDPEYAQHLAVREFKPDDYEYEYQKALMEGMGASTNPEVQALLSLTESDLSRSTKRLVSGVFQYIYDKQIPLEQATEFVEDEHKYVEALMYTVQKGSETERERAENSLSSMAEGRVMEMNLLKGKRGRFDAVKDASATALYATIVYGGDYARPSTAKPLFDRLHKQMQSESVSAEQFIDQLEGVEFPHFVNLASFNNRFDDFLRLAESHEAQQELIHRFVAGVEEADTEERMSAISQVIVFSRDKAVLDQIKQELENEYQRVVSEGDEKGQAAYGVLSGLYGEEATWLGERVAEYQVELPDKLEVKDMFNERGENVQVYYFYNDEDGVDSFRHFLSQYERSKEWEVTDHGTFVEVAAQKDERRVIIYANKPGASIGGEDKYMDITKAQEQERQEKPGWRYNIADVPIDQWPDEGRPDGFANVEAYMEGQDQKSHIQVHRGHAYWTYYSQQQVAPETKLYFDGSCGGADEVEKVLRVAPEAQVLYNSDEGKAGINDSLLQNINERLLAGQDLDWADIRLQTERDILRWYDEDAAPEAVIAYQRYVFPDQGKAKAAAV
ncbi:hypothetical protein IH979_02565, partial [Patescibacteria group bacterium]|nr:hypothetical protein [Patescibacteria group bacterium]